MELVYLWVEEYKNIKNQGFNFSPRFRCEYDPDTNELTIEENDDYIENFFGENINVTAIVGKNGSGKSSLLELIWNLSHWTSIEYSIFYFILKKDGSKEIKKINFKDLKTDIKQTTIKNRDKNRHSKGYVERVQFDVVYLTLSVLLSNINTFYTNREKNFYSLYNYNRDYKNYNFNYDEFWNFIILKIPALLDNELIRKFFKIKSKPKYFFIQLTNEMEKYCKDEVKKIKDKSKVISQYTDDYFRYLEINNDNLKLIVELNNKLNEKIKDLNKEFNKKQGMYNKNKKNAKFVYEEPSLYDNPFDEPEIKLNSAGSIAEVLKLRLNYIERVLPNLKLTIYFTSDIDSYLSFTFSSGELVLLYYMHQLIQISKKNDKFTLLIDEIELHLHPAWQKSFLKFLLDLFENKKINIILTTHSPFLLSDIPKQNIIFLDTDENGNCIVADGLNDKKETFGANIHTLLSDSFFMEDGLTGEFAKGKINEVIKLLNKEHLEPNEIKYCEEIISIIGEPIIKNQLQRMLDSKRLKKIDRIDEIEKNIQALQEELEKLKNAKS